MNSMQPSSVSATPILFSDAAAMKVAELIAEEGQPGLHLRIYVSDGGCSGFQYGFAFEADAKPGDLVVENLGVRLLIDANSLIYLRGAEVDFQDNLEGSRFIIKNPNAKATCGCGNSFSTADSGGSDAHLTNSKSCSSRPANLG